MLDILFLVAMALAVYKGVTKGVVYAFFSFIGLVIGAAAAARFSSVAANYLSDQFHINGAWTPFLGFIVVFTAAVGLVRMAGKFIEKTVEWAFLGWVNKIGGVIFYALIYLLLLSLVYYYGEKMGIISESAISNSKTYPWVQPWAPFIIELLGKLVPWFADTFKELEKLFAQLAEKIPAP